MIGFIFFIIFSIIGAQTITIIDAQTDKPVENVNVFANNNGTLTDNYGSCSLDIFKKSDQITFSMIGYKTITLPNSEISKMIYLEKESIPMELVSVFGKNRKSKKRYATLEKNVRKVLKGKDIVIHAAAVTSGSKEVATNPIKFVSDNVIMNSLICKYSTINKVKKVVLMTSIFYPGTGYIDKCCRSE